MPNEGPGEKRQDEGESRGLERCWQSDRIDAFGWGSVLIWGGLVLLAGLTGFAARFAWWSGWSVFLTGAGVITLTEAGIHLFIPEHRQHLIWNLVCGFVLLGFGLGDRVWPWILSPVLIVIGIAVLKGAFVRRR